MAGLALLGPSALAAKPERPDNWNYPNRNYFRCVKLKNPSAIPLRFSGYNSVTGYSLMRSDLVYRQDPSEEAGFCRKGQARLDAHEALTTADGKVLYLHKGGVPGYSKENTPYGHLFVGDIKNARGPTPLRAAGPPEDGIPSAIPKQRGRWDKTKRNGRGCKPTGQRYQVLVHPRADAPRIDVDDPKTYNPNEIPPTWQYKPGRTSSRYNKYANAGEEQGSGTAERPVGANRYAYLLWSWLTRGDGKTNSPGGGIVRSLITPSQPFYPCNIASINSNAYAIGTSTVVGKVTAIYGATAPSANSPVLYGWAIHSHRRIDPKTGAAGPRVFDMQPF